VVHRSGDAPTRLGSTARGLAARVAGRAGEVLLVGTPGCCSCFNQRIRLATDQAGVIEQPDFRVYLSSVRGDDIPHLLAGEGLEIDLAARHIGRCRRYEGPPGGRQSLPVVREHHRRLGRTRVRVTASHRHVAAPATLPLGVEHKARRGERQGGVLLERFQEGSGCSPRMTRRACGAAKTIVASKAMMPANSATTRPRLSILSFTVTTYPVCPPLCACAERPGDATSVHPPSGGLARREKCRIVSVAGPDHPSGNDDRHLTARGRREFPRSRIHTDPVRGLK
jgi:hypothetical protein